MKSLIVLSAVLALATALPQRKAPSADLQTEEQNYNNYQQQQQQQYRKPVDDFRPRVEIDTTTFIPIIHFDKEQGTDGSYKTSYETGNNIYAQEDGSFRLIGDKEDAISALTQAGSYTYTAPDGTVINTEYIADENGFRVKGDHIPTPPPVSPEIQKGLDLIFAGIKANAERAEAEARNNPEAAKDQQEKAALNYKGLYYQS